jgi:hypothetical protein
MKPKQKVRLHIVVIFGVIMMSCLGLGAREHVVVTNPLQNALFPLDFRAPVFKWEDSSSADNWSIMYGSEENPAQSVPEVRTTEWRPAAPVWADIKKLSLGRDLDIIIKGYHLNRQVSSGSITIKTSADPVEAPIFYREVPLPVTEALKDLPAIKWKLGWPARDEQPAVVLQGMKICANCHSFDRRGTVMGMDADFQGDKGAYVIADISRETTLEENGVISWSGVHPEPGVRTFGLFATLSSDGRYVASTINDIAVYKMLPQISYSQLFFPVKGQIAYYDRQEKKYNTLAGADNPEFVQTNPVFSPDGKTLVFAGSELFDKSIPVKDFIERRAFYEYDLYRIPFPNTEGTEAEKLDGASGNGLSNYFPKFSPDGKWLVFTQSRGFMIIQPDAELVIIPAEGGKPRVMKCNFPGKMNSWHSFSPNGKWMVFAAKSNGPYTLLWLTHLDEEGQDSVPVLLENYTPADRAANLPEFVNIDESKMHSMVNFLPDK